MTFGAWCVRDYGFDYRVVRRHGGIAFFPYVDGDTLKWRENPAYQRGELIIEEARTYEDFFLEPGVPIYMPNRINLRIYSQIPVSGMSGHGDLLYLHYGPGVRLPGSSAVNQASDSRFITWTRRQTIGSSEPGVRLPGSLSQSASAISTLPERA